MGKTPSAIRHSPFAIGLACALLALQASAQKPSPPDPEDVARRVVALTNEFRSQEGRGQVEVSEKLTAAARYFADYLGKSEQFTHGADGSSPIARAQKHGYDSTCVWENISHRYGSSAPAADELARAFVEGWKGSPLHRRNMLEAEATETGIAVAPARNDSYYAVQMFGLPGSQVIEFTILNRSESSLNYVLGDRTFPLGPTDVRTHKQCRTEALTFEFRKQERSAPVRPKRGDRLRIVRLESGEFRIVGAEP
jgi:uncharacterized protein YkwD